MYFIVYGYVVPFIHQQFCLEKKNIIIIMLPCWMDRMDRMPIHTADIYPFLFDFVWPMSGRESYIVLFEISQLFSVVYR